ncbi:RNA-binding protein, putative [Plasmodium ovale wallikeri]|uniref:RNA-binding protein, putative n=1 Tax=Plasmodium ovale wallikeri TaxID=864142 RepID=A0A1A8YS01_PLAOA|nr:RNA-binding protein, putative [Plasmodium ovale wallikeri]
MGKYNTSKRVEEGVEKYHHREERHEKGDTNSYANKSDAHVKEKDSYYAGEGRRYASRSREKGTGGRENYKGENYYNSYRKSSVDNHHGKRHEQPNGDRNRNHSKGRKDYHRDERDHHERDHHERDHHERDHHERDHHERDHHERDRERDRHDRHDRHDHRNLSRERLYNRSPRRNFSKERNKNIPVYDRNSERKYNDKYRLERESNTKWDNNNGHNNIPGVFNNSSYRERNERMHMRRYTPEGERQRSSPYDNNIGGHINNSYKMNVGMIRRERPPYMRHDVNKKGDPCKIFVGNISDDAREEDVRKKFSQYGEIFKMQWKRRFAFIEYYKPAHAESAIQAENGKYFLGENLSVQPHHPSPYLHNYRGDFRGDYRGEYRNDYRSDYRNDYRNDYRSDYRNDYRNDHRGDYRGDHRNFQSRYTRNYSPHRAEFREKKNTLRIVVKNVDEKASWQDLKDFGREVGSVNYANIIYDNNKERCGIIEYYNYETMKKAVEVLNGKKFNGNVVEVIKYTDSSLDFANKQKDKERDQNYYNKEKGHRDDSVDADKEKYKKERIYDRDRNYEKNKTHRDDKVDTTTIQGGDDSIGKKKAPGTDKDYYEDVGKDNNNGGFDKKIDGEDGNGNGNENEVKCRNEEKMERKSQMSAGVNEEVDRSGDEEEEAEKGQLYEQDEEGKKKDKYKRGSAGGRYGRNYKRERSESVGDHAKEDEPSLPKKEKADVGKNDREVSTRGGDDEEEEGHSYKSDRERSTESTNVKGGKSEKNTKRTSKMGRSDNASESRSRSNSSVKQKSYKRNVTRRRASKMSDGSSAGRDLRDSYDDNVNNEKWSPSKKVCATKCNSTESGS